MADSAARTRPDETDGTVTLRDLLAVSDLGLGLVTGADALGRAVRWAHSTELLDPRAYLRGDELVLTVGTALASPAACTTLVSNLVAAGAAGLGFGLGDVSDEVPDALVRACEAVGLPLLSVPPGMPFLAIAELIADRRAEARAARGRRTQQLIAVLLDALAADASLPELLRHAADGLGGALALIGEQQAILAATHDPVGPPAASVSVNGTGRLIWWPLGEADPLPEGTALSQVAQVLALHLHERDAGRAQARAELGRLLTLVVDGRADAEALSEAIGRVGIASTEVTAVAWQPSAAPLVAASLPRAALADLADVSVALTDDVDAVERLALRAALPCGIGDAVHLTGLRHSVPSAVAALALSRHRGRPVRSEDLTSFDGLLEQQPAERLAPFARQLVAPLAEHDARHGTKLLTTLRAFLAGEGAVNATARELFLHPNSLRHRLSRIHDLTGRNPLDFADRVALAVGLWAWDRRGLRGGPTRVHRR